MAIDISLIRAARIELEKGEDFFCQLNDLINNHLESGTSLKDVICWLQVTQHTMTEAMAEAVYDDDEDE
tara:strand:+ start:11736 stop:11942 length:207 start_codon:yes stop_codon:yes gene_type:complete